MADVDFHRLAKDVIHHNYASVVVLTVVLCECMSTLEDEVQYIWQSPWSKTKCTYLFARYFAIAYLIANIGVSLVWPPTIPVSQSRCTVWYLQGVASFCTLYIASQITLSRRILETYEVRNVGSALLVFHVAELAAGLVSGKGTLSAATFNGVCDMFNIPKDVFIFVGMLLLGQLLMWALILGGFRRRGADDSPPPCFREMVYRMWYDGDAKIAWATTCLCFVVNAYRATLNQKVKPVYLFAWPICLISIGTCRYILSMKRHGGIRTKGPSLGSNGKERKVQTCDESNDICEPSLEFCCSDPCERPSFVHSAGSSRRNTVRVSHPGSFETLSSDSLRWKHPSCLQRVVDVSTISDGSTSRPSSIPSSNLTFTESASSVSTWSRSSISSHTTRETDITVPSIGARSSINVEIGSLHSSSSANSEELREFWNEVWSGDEHAFIYT